MRNTVSDSRKRYDKNIRLGAASHSFYGMSFAHC
jgi:hypothetical protein